MPTHIFISYAKKDTQPLAFQLHDALHRVPGVTAWVDRSLEYGASWAQQIEQQIDACDYVVVLISQDVNRPETPGQGRSFVRIEIDYAKECKKPIIPVMAQHTKLPLQLSGIQYINYVGPPTMTLDALVGKILEAVKLQPPRSLPAATPLPQQPPSPQPAPAGRPFARLEVYWPEGRTQAFDLAGDQLTVGRSPENTISLETDTISRYQFRIRRKQGYVYISDLDSANGTYINSKRLNRGEEVLLRGGETIQIGRLRLVYRLYR
jgi:hypothetical protein